MGERSDPLQRGAPSDGWAGGRAPDDGRQPERDLLERAGRLRGGLVHGEHGQRVPVERGGGLPDGEPCAAGSAPELLVPEGGGSVLRPDHGVLPDAGHGARREALRLLRRRPRQLHRPQRAYCDGSNIGPRCPYQPVRREARTGYD